jgi:hypothetical protein
LVKKTPELFPNTDTNGAVLGPSEPLLPFFRKVWGM